VLQITGTAETQPSEIDLKQGWNEIIWPYESPLGITGGLYGLVYGVDYDQVSSFNNTTKAQEDFLNQPGDTLTKFDPDKVYYIHMLDEKKIEFGDPAEIIPQDTIAPYGIIKINNDAQYTNSAAVTLTLSAQDNTGGSGLSQIQFSNDNSVWSTPEAYSLTKAWILTFGEGTKTVYAKFKDVAGNWSAAVSDTIFFDATAPAGTIKINNDAADTENAAVTLNLTAQDSLEGSGIDKIQFSNDNITWSDPETFTETKSWNLSSGSGEKTVYVKFSDIAGNWSGVYLDTIIFQEVVEVGGSITINTTWSKDKIYKVINTISVNNGAILTIDPGTIIKFYSGKDIEVGTDSTLNAIGTPAEPILFTSNSAVPAAKDWSKIRIGGSGKAVISNSIIEYADTGVVAINLTNPVTISNTLIRNCDKGIEVNNSSPAISNNIIIDNREGIRCVVSGAAEIISNTITNNIEVGIYCVGAYPNGRPFPTIHNNSIYGNGQYDFKTENYGEREASGNYVLNARNNWWGTADFNQINAKIFDYPDWGGQYYRGCWVDFNHFLDAAEGNPASGEYIWFPITTNTIWTKTNGPYFITGNDSSLGTGVTLTIQPGTVIKFYAGKSLNAGTDATLNASGTPQEPILFTSNSAAPAAKDWDGIRFLGKGTISNSIIEYANVGITADSNSVIISNSVFRNCDRGIETGASPIIANNAISSNSTGISCLASASPEISGNNITNNAQNGISCIGLPGQGQLPFPKINNNSIYGNGVYNLKTEKYTNQGNAGNYKVDAAKNWWGTTNIESINTSIYDFADNYYSPVVNIQPFSGQDTVEVNLLPGINIISLPVIPNDPAVSKVFAELQEQGLLAGNLYKWNNLTSSWIVYNGNDAEFGDIRAGLAYKIIVPTAQILHFYGGKIMTDFSIGLSLGKNIFGNPFDNDAPVVISSVKNISTGEIKSLQQAVSLGWIDTDVEGWDAAAQISTILDLSADLTGINFSRAAGYWISAKVTGLELILPVRVPDILSVDILPNPFSPDEDFIEDSAVITVTLTAPGFPRVSIFDVNNNLVKELLLIRKQVPANTYEVVWDGSNTGGSYVKNGSYTAYIDLGSKLRREQRTIQVNKYPLITNYSAAPNPFSPDNDGKDDISTIVFNLSEDTKLSLTISDSNNNIVRKLADNQIVTVGNHSYIWDGKSDTGVLLDEGRYTAIIEAQAAIGGVINKVQLNLYLVSISDIKLPQLSFNPGSGESCTISYNLSKDAILSIRIYNSDDLLVRNLLNNQPRAAGIHTDSWDGKDDNGNIIPDGAYYFIIEDSISGQPLVVFDPRGTGGQDISHSVYLQAADFNPLANTPAILSYNLPQAANVTIKVRTYRLYGPAIKVIKYVVPEPSGSNQAVWDGRDELGQIVGNGSNTFALWAYTLVDKSIVVTGGMPKLLESILVSPDINFSPKDNPYSQGAKQININYKTSKPCNVYINMYNENNVLVKTLLNSQARPTGQNIEIWDGKADNGVLAPEGLYRIDLQLESNGNYSEIYSAAALIYY
ncbi:MAG: FlgD immunoglobulin-like domain containing protein, partial [Candidatus Omnitrophota bacterium]